MNIKLQFENANIKSIKFHKNGKVKQEVYYNGTILEYDENRNVIHYKESDGYEYWYEYDERGNNIYYKDSNGHEWWKEYDENNTPIYLKVNDKVRYDERGE